MSKPLELDNFSTNDSENSSTGTDSLTEKLSRLLNKKKITSTANNIMVENNEGNLDKFASVLSEMKNDILKILELLNYINNELEINKIKSSDDINKVNLNVTTKIGHIVNKLCQLESQSTENDEIVSNSNNSIETDDKISKLLAPKLDELADKFDKKIKELEVTVAKTRRGNIAMFR